MKRPFVGLVFVLAVSAASPAADSIQSQTARTSQSNTNQVVQCGPGQAVSGDLGYAGTECHGCTISGKHLAGEPDIEFAAEPVLSGIRKDGPADGKLQEGDLLVAIDGQAITTREAAVHLSWLKPNFPVRLTVRRLGVLVDVEIRPAPRCRPVTQPHVIALIDDRSISQRSGSALSPTPHGWIGMALDCGECGTTFPVVARVWPNGPAAQAGLEEGDVLLAIDGKSLKTREATLILHKLEPNQRFTILLLRDHRTMTLTLTAGSRPG
jgi:S1-C subfamily serine protease